MRLYIIFIHLVFTLFSLNVFGESNTDTNELEYIYTNFTTRDGLPSNETYCVFQDSRGYIWIGTDRGLVRYDGYEFKVFTVSDGLIDNVILAINEDDNGNLWYTGLNDKRLGYIDSNLNFHEYKHNARLIESISQVKYPYVYFNEIHISGESIYLVNRLYGYIKLNAKGIEELSAKYYDKNDGKRYGIGTYIKSHKDIHFIYSDICSFYTENFPGKVYVQDELIFEYLRGGCDERYPTLIYNDTIHYIYDGNMMLTIKEKKVKHEYLERRSAVYSIPGKGYIFSTSDKEKKKQIVYFSKSPDIHHPKIKILENVFVSDVIQDHNGRIWITTDKKGIYYFQDFTSKRSKQNYQVEAIVPYKEGVLLQESNERQLYFNIASDEVSSGNYVLKQNDLLNIKNRMDFFSNVQFYDDWIKELGIGGGNSYSLRGTQLLSDSLLYIWNRRAHFKIKKGKVSFRYYDYRYTVDSLFGYLDITSLYCLKEDSCYLATKDGLYMYTINQINTLDFSVNQSIRGVEYDRSQQALIYSVWGKGLVVRWKNGTSKELTIKDGLSSNFINQLYRDDQGTLWLATNKGIDKCTLNENGIKIETIINSSKLLKSPNVLQLYSVDSFLYVGTDQGFNVLDLRTLYSEKDAIIPLYLDSVFVEGMGRMLSPNLRYDQNNLTFSFTALSYNQYENINYRYRLNGLSDTWIQTKERKAIFTAVNPGTYTFELEVQNEYGDWIQLENPPEFTIHKPYWSTWWFIGGGVLLGILIVGGALYYYISNLKKEKAFLENEQQLSNELNESQQKALSSQLNPHFVFNSLNSIQNFILTKRTELSSDYLSMFSKLMRYIFENSKKLYVSLTDEIEALRLYLELEQVRHNHKFRYEIDSGDLDTSEFSLPALLIQPMIENAIWHGLLHKLEDDRLLQIKFKANESHLLIEVIDNGVGRGGSQPRKKFIKKQRSSGVELTKQRLHLLSQSTGLSTSFEIVDLVDEEGNPQGTRVEISIPVKLEE